MNEDTIPWILQEVYDQIGITEVPAAIHTKECTQALPQYEVGHYKKLNEIEAFNEIVISG